MAVRGTNSKSIIVDEILALYGERAFIASDGKTIRVSCVEDGEPVEIKITLTAAKDIEGNMKDDGIDTQGFVYSTTNTAVPVPDPTEEEMQAVQDLVYKLGL